MAFEGKNRLTAIITNNRFMAANLIAAAARTGLSIPRDLSIATYNDEYPTAHLWPTVTAVGHPKELLADRATQCLIDAMRAWTCLRKSNCP